MLKIAKVKSEKEFYKKYPSEEAFMKAHGKAFKKAAMGSQMVNDQLHQLTEWEGAPKYQGGGAVNPNTGMFNMPMLGKSVSQVDTMAAGYGTVAPPEGFGNAAKGAGGFDGAGAAMAGLGAIQGIVGGIEAMGAQKKARAKAKQNTQLSGLALEAQQGMQDPKRKYVTPYDISIQPGQFGNPYGNNTNYLQAENGRMIGGNPTEIQNMYNPGDMYTDLGFEPLGETLKQFKHGGGMHKAELGDYFQDSGQAQIGSSVGGAIGSAIGGPAGQMIGSLLGKVGGNLLGGAKDARELQAEQSRGAMNNAQLAFSQSNQFGAYMKDGGWVSHDWQPQTFTKFGEYDAKDLLKPPHDADMLRSGGHLKDEYYTPPSAEALYTGRPDMPKAFAGLAMGMLNKGMIDTVQNSEKANKLKQAVSAGMMEQGGQMAMGGDLEVLDGGKAETISYNPFLPDGGETVMFKGRSHDNGGIPINFGENGVEVEGGEPAVKLQNGGEENNMVVFGNIKINKNIADLMGDPKAKGKKFKHYVADIAKNDAKQLKIIDKATDIINNANNNSAAGHLELITANLMKKGAEDYQKMNAENIQEAGIVQNAILDTASQLGVKSDRLAEGKLEKEKDARMMAKNGKKLKKAQNGDYEYFDPKDNYLEEVVTSQNTGSFINPNTGMYQLPMNKNSVSRVDAMSAGYGSVAPSEMFGNTGAAASMVSDVSNQSSGFGQKLKLLGQTLGKGIDKYGPTLLSNVSPWLRPSNANEALPADQLYPEYYSMATNQLEPVQAQTFQPMLDTPMDISLNDQINAIDSQSRAAIRAAGSNPAAQAMIMSQSLEAKNKVLGEQTRINAANKMQTYDKNRALVNDAKLKNLQILDQQYVRQAQAKSNTKEQTFNALSSIAAKTAQQRAANRQLAVMENLYNFRFTPSGKAINANAPAQFNTLLASAIQSMSPDDVSKLKEVFEKQVSKDKTGSITGSKEKTTVSKQSRNGSIVNALKNL